MKLAATLLAVLVTTGAAASDVYKVNVTRKDQDLYALDSGMYVKTRYCYEYAYGEEAILRVDSPYGYTVGHLIFKNMSHCEVASIFRG